MSSSRQPKKAAGEKKPKRNRAPQIRNWLTFIRPHADRYSALPRGEQKKFIDQLAQTSGSSENTLRRYIAAARVLETYGIREIPPGRKHLPVASVEAIERISKKDPDRGRRLFQFLLEGGNTARILKDTLRDTLENGPQQTPPPEKLSADRILTAVARQAYVGREDLVLVHFKEVPVRSGFNLLARTAAPQLAVLITRGRTAAVFDQSVLAWSAGAALITREFLRNIAVATATFDYVVVLCTTLASEVEKIVAEMPQTCRDRVVVLNGMFDPDT